MQRSSEALIEGGSLSYAEVTVLEDARSTTYGNECLACLTLENGYPITVALRLDRDVQVRYGDIVSCTFALKNPLYETSPYWWNKGVAAILHVKQCTVHDPGGGARMLLHARNTAIDSMRCHDGEEAAIIGALACGWRFALFKTSLYDNFRTCGLAHLVAVSGAHVVIVVSSIGALLRALRASRRLTVVILTATMLSYLVLAGCPLSALRATIMGIVSLSSFFSRRRPSSLNALGICISLMIAHSPFCSFSLSLLLSFASTAGIVIFSPYMRYLFRRTSDAIPAFVVEPAALTISAQIVSLPLSISSFGQIPLIALVANIVGTPLFPLICTASFVYGITCTIAPAFSPIAFSLANALVSVLSALVQVLASAPFASIPATFSSPCAAVSCIALPFTLWCAWPRLEKRRIRWMLTIATTCIIALMTVVPLLIPTRIVMLNVGQGDAILIQSQGKAMLIDTGNHDLMLKEALARQGVFHLDAVIITHTDDDHCGSLEALATAVHIDRVIVSESLMKCSDRASQDFITQAGTLTESVIGVNVGDTISFGECTMVINWPYQLIAEGGNEDSLCCTLYADVDHDGESDCKALFTGDAEVEQLRDIITLQDLGTVDIIKVPHHGSAAGLDRELLASIHPSIALIGVGQNNRYGHPKQETLMLLEDAGACVWRTDLNGDIACTIHPDAVVVTTQY